MKRHLIRKNPKSVVHPFRIAQEGERKLSIIESLLEENTFPIVEVSSTFCLQNGAHYTIPNHTTQYSIVCNYKNLNAKLMF